MSRPGAEGGDGRPRTVEVLTAWFETRAGGLLVPLAAAILAFLAGGLVVLFTGNNPLGVYKAIFDGTGLTYLFPWVQGSERATAARNLQQTLLVATPLMLTAIAVAFAFRCGMFNIGGQGQYWIGLIAALVVGTHVDLPPALHVPACILAAIVAGAIWGGVAGVLKATVGAHEVISTIMLNWIAIFGGKYLFELGGPLQGEEEFIPRSNDVTASAKLPAIWGTLQPLHAGIFVALAALVVYHLLLNRTTLGYEVRAVGFNPEAARYGGISVSRNYFLAMAIAGTFAGLAGALDLLGWKFRVATNDFDVGMLGFIGIAVALLGRNKAVGILFAALFFAALQVGTSTRQLDPTVFPPALAVNLATIIQALIILFVGAEILIVSLWGARRYVRRGRRVRAQPAGGSGGAA
ncbi:MAG: ABC transporter permease [Gaiellaceae bacterium]|nr:MAG: ABC transporter permease [Gaiellaceae bacterium]